jgi:SAM-dependent methyltransferase
MNDWIRNYHQKPKDFLSSNLKTIHRRLHLLGVGKLPHDSLILDMGCGNGESTKYLQDAGFGGCFGVDPSERLVSLSRARNLIVGKGQSLPFKQGSFDCVLVIGVLHHLSRFDLPIVIREIKRCLSKRGILAICEPCPGLWRTITHVLLFSPLGLWFDFSRSKRALVRIERRTLKPWLDHYNRNIKYISDRFKTHKRIKKWIKEFHVFTI